MITSMPSISSVRAPRTAASSISCRAGEGVWWTIIRVGITPSLDQAAWAAVGGNRVLIIREYDFDRSDCARAPRPGRAMTESSLEAMISIFDVRPLDSALARFAGDSDGGGRGVVDGSQILAQCLVAASKALPGRTVRCAHALFVSPASPASPIELAVTPLRAGRSMASAVVCASQDGRACATATVLLDRPQPDVIRHDKPAGPSPG